ncbi:hypothetical protein Sjap_025404 [Stephania japonica]|uniref:Apple domain-containing protein n=1 Tax=Stephania japonica TaxID=461633 RepID=A0AAP0E4S7_9MAGN
MKLPDTSNATVDMSLGIKDCEIKCRSNCSCTGYSSAEVNGSGCLAWFGDLVDMGENTDGGQDIFVRVDAIELEDSMKHSKGSFIKKKLVLILCVVIGGLCFCYFFKKAKGRGLLQRNRLRKQLFSPSLETNEETNANGYMSPEYAMDGLFSIKSDVFSFGVLLLKIISGKKNSGFYQEDPSMNLIKHAWELWRDGRVLELVDPTMGNSFPEQEVVRFIQVGVLCVQENAKDRPTMYNVIFMLGNETPIPSPKQPAFVLISNPNSAYASASPSITEMSITIVEGR